jgi:hypothetical protein
MYHCIDIDDILGWPSDISTPVLHQACRDDLTDSMGYVEW